VPVEKLPNVQVVADEEAKEVAVASPYDKRFVEGAKRLGGKWFPDEKVWVFPLEAKSKVMTLTKKVYGEEEVWEGPLPRKDELIIYRARVYIYKGEVFLGMLFADAEEPEEADLCFYYCYANRAGPVFFATYNRMALGTLNKPRVILHPERRLPVEMEMAIRWRKPYLSPLGPELPDKARVGLEEDHPYLQRFLKTGDVGECSYCGGPLIKKWDLWYDFCSKCGSRLKKDKA